MCGSGEICVDDRADAREGDLPEFKLKLDACVGDAGASTVFRT